jgi:hypothetical protein
VSQLGSAFFNVWVVLFVYVHADKAAMLYQLIGLARLKLSACREGRQFVFACLPGSICEDVILPPSVFYVGQHGVEVARIYRRCIAV